VVNLETAKPESFSSCKTLLPQQCRERKRKRERWGGGRERERVCVALFLNSSVLTVPRFLQLSPMGAILNKPTCFDRKYMVGMRFRNLCKVLI
jgi:hypothetical protein